MEIPLSIVTNHTHYSYEGRLERSYDTVRSTYLVKNETDVVHRPSSSRPGSVWYNHRGKDIILTGHKVGSERSETFDHVPLVYDRFEQPMGWDNPMYVGTSYYHSYYNNSDLSVLEPTDLWAVVEQLTRVAHNQALANANASEWDLSTFFAEAPETVAYIGGRLNDAYNAFRRLGRPKRRPKSKKRKDRIGDGSSSWMEYRYAIMPTVYDIQDALKALHFEEHKFRTARGSASDRVDKEETQDLGYGVKRRISQTIDIRAMSAVYSIFTAEQERKLQTQFYLPQTAWELVKLSFVVDWFIGIGDVVQSLRPVHYEQRAATDSTKIVWQTVATLDASGLKPGGIASAGNPRFLGPTSSYIYKDSYERRLSSVNPVLPPIQANLNWKRCLDGFALSWPSLRRGFQSIRRWFN